MREKIVGKNIYHVLNRGVDKRKIFSEEIDYVRFVHDLFEFNNEDPAPKLDYLFKTQYSEVGLPNIGSKKERKPRKLLVDLLAFTLMPNHYHLLIRPRNDDSLSGFMQKLNTGYTNYFNQKYRRAGALFSGKYKYVAIKSDQHFVHIPYYIHCNPLDLEKTNGNWRDRNIKSYEVALRFLNQYKWSSHQDYSGIKNFPSVTQREFLLEYFRGIEGYKQAIRQWLKDFDFESTKTIRLEE